MMQVSKTWSTYNHIYRISLCKLNYWFRMLPIQYEFVSISDACWWDDVVTKVFIGLSNSLLWTVMRYLSSWWIRQFKNIIWRNVLAKKLTHIQLVKTRIELARCNKINLNKKNVLHILIIILHLSNNTMSIIIRLMDFS